MPEDNLTYLLTYNISVAGTSVVLLTNSSTTPFEEGASMFSAEISSAEFLVAGVRVDVVVYPCTLVERGEGVESSVDIPGGERGGEPEGVKVVVLSLPFVPGFRAGVNSFGIHAFLIAMKSDRVS